MPVRVLLLGRLADLAGSGEIEIAGPLDWAGLLSALPPDLAHEVRSDRVKVALDGAVWPDKYTLNAGDGGEIALLPPVSGG